MGTTWNELRNDLPAGSYRVVVDSYDPVGQGPFELTVNFADPAP
jgi:hypothetical protein